ncbi:P-loop containing nucleoside triphosphate hydrolase protein [Mycena sp. CBHHK59/15]|nr:P-loop containing nucleoside triphosphate hydrolase protein [Mycena sp. CBHHK59/15]
MCAQGNYIPTGLPLPSSAAAIHPLIVQVFDSYTENIEVDGTTIMLGLWDTVGVEEHDRLRLCATFTRITSFDNVRNRWYAEISHHAPGTPIVLVGPNLIYGKSLGSLWIGEAPNTHTGPIWYAQGAALAKRIGAAKYLECSAPTQVGVKAVFEEAVRTAQYPNSFPVPFTVPKGEQMVPIHPKT